MEIKQDRNQAVDESADDPELSEWAKKLLTRAVPQVSNCNQNSGLDKPNLLTTYSSFDLESAIGKFAWHTIGKDKDIPCLFRSGSKYCCIRMVESSVTGDLQKILPQVIYDSANLHCQPATAHEAKLLTLINSWHCEGYYGKEPFTEKDIMLPVQELEEFYSYLSFANKIFSDKGLNNENDFSRCGFVRVNNSCLIPYTVLRSEMGGEKGVPLFYFEGKTKVLETNAKLLTGWDLAYLKICCILQGVKKVLIAGDSLKIVNLSDVRSHFSKDTSLTEQCWLYPNEIRFFATKHHKKADQHASEENDATAGSRKKRKLNF